MYFQMNLFIKILIYLSLASTDLNWNHVLCLNSFSPKEKLPFSGSYWLPFDYFGIVKCLLITWIDPSSIIKYSYTYR